MYKSCETREYTRLSCWETTLNKQFLSKLTASIGACWARIEASSWRIRTSSLCATTSCALKGSELESGWGNVGCFLEQGAPEEGSETPRSLPLTNNAELPSGWVTREACMSRMYATPRLRQKLSWVLFNRNASPCLLIAVSSLFRSGKCTANKVHQERNPTKLRAQYLRSTSCWGWQHQAPGARWMPWVTF